MKIQKTEKFEKIEMMRSRSNWKAVLIIDLTG